jgi:hypothetical protein
MKMTPLEHTLLVWLECLGTVALTVMAIILVSLFIAAIVDIINS